MMIMKKSFLLLLAAACMLRLPAVALTNNTPVPGAPVIFKALPPHPVYGTRVDFSTARMPRSPVNVFSQSYVMDPYRRPYMGLQIRDMGSQLAAFFGVESGALVESVDTNGPAHEAEVRAGDVIVAFQEGPVGSIDDLFAELDDMRSGDRIALSIVRRGEPLALNLTLVDRPGPPTQFALPDDLKNTLGKVNVIFGNQHSEHLRSLMETMRRHIPPLRMPDEEVGRIEDEEVRKEIERLRTEFEEFRNDMQREHRQAPDGVVESGTGPAK